MTYDREDADSDTSSIDHDGREPRDGWDQSSPPSVTIVETIAEATERDPTALPLLNQTVDPDALDTLLTRGMQREEHVYVSFAYDGAQVSVGSDGDLSIRTDETTHDPERTGPETSAELEAMLQELLRLAFRNGVSVTGGYGVRNGPESPDWDVHITQVEKPRDEET
jgi:hypothetical protein